MSRTESQMTSDLEIAVTCLDDGRITLSFICPRCFAVVSSSLHFMELISGEHIECQSELCKRHSSHPFDKPGFVLFLHLQGEYVIETDGMLEGPPAASP